MDELDFGTRLPTYAFEPKELTAAIDALLDGPAADDRRARAANVAARLQASPGTVRAADLIERLAREGTPIERE
jgi:UDP:flavonoid glycosyltransferase YjiC (YdhE family)